MTSQQRHQLAELFSFEGSACPPPHSCLGWQSERAAHPLAWLTLLLALSLQFSTRVLVYSSRNHFPTPLYCPFCSYCRPTHCLGLRYYYSAACLPNLCRGALPPTRRCISPNAHAYLQMRTFAHAYVRVYTHTPKCVRARLFSSQHAHVHSCISTCTRSHIRTRTCREASATRSTFFWMGSSTSLLSMASTSLISLV